MRVYCKEVLHTAEASNRMNRLFIVNKAVRFRDWRAEPKYPTVSEGVCRRRCAALRASKRSP